MDDRVVAILFAKLLFVDDFHYKGLKMYFYTVHVNLTPSTVSVTPKLATTRPCHWGSHVYMQKFFPFAVA